MHRPTTRRHGRRACGGSERMRRPGKKWCWKVRLRDPENNPDQGGGDNAKMLVGGRARGTPGCSAGTTEKTLTVSCPAMGGGLGSAVVYSFGEFDWGCEEGKEGGGTGWLAGRKAEKRAGSPCGRGDREHGEGLALAWASGWTDWTGSRVGGLPGQGGARGWPGAAGANTKVTARRDGRRVGNARHPGAGRCDDPGSSSYRVGSAGTGPSFRAEGNRGRSQT